MTIKIILHSILLQEIFIIHDRFFRNVGKIEYVTNDLVEYLADLIHNGMK